MEKSRIRSIKLTLAKYLTPLCFCLCILFTFGGCKEQESFKMYQMGSIPGNGFYCVQEYNEHDLYEDVVIPDTYQGVAVRYILSDAFEDCSVQSVTMTNIEYIYGGAFLLCDKLQTVELGKVKSIGISAFSCCISLKSITFPGTVDEIDNNAFGGCNDLENVYFEGNPVKLGLGLFPYFTVIHGPSGGTVEEYAKSNGHTFIPTDT